MPQTPSSPPRPSPSDQPSPPHLPHPAHTPPKPPSVSLIMHPLLPPLISPAAALRAQSAAHQNDVGTAQSLYSSVGTSGPSPEKCLTFCSQRSDAHPFCRMLCLRRRTPAMSRQEALARLRPPTQHRDRDDSHRASLHTPASAPFSSSASIASASGSQQVSSSAWWADFHPFETLRRNVEPYSIIYARGTPDGVVGRYMEELEYDDGVHDFGAISPSGEYLGRRKRSEDSGYEWLDWGEHGALLHLPLTSLLHPILQIPTTLTFLLSPTLNFLTHYRDSFADGSQTRMWSKFCTEVEGGGAWGVLLKARSHWQRKVREKMEDLERTKSEEREEAGTGVEGKRHGVGKVRDGEGAQGKGQ